MMNEGHYSGNKHDGVSEETGDVKHQCEAIRHDNSRKTGINHQCEAE